MAKVDKIRAVVVKLRHDSYPTPWVACTMSMVTYEVIGDEDWEEWKRKALDLCLADHLAYEVREVTLRIPQDKLEELFSVESIDVEVGS